MSKDEFQQGFEAGFISAIKTYGIYRDGEQLIGVREHNVKQLAEEIRRGEDTWFNNELTLARKGRDDVSQEMVDR